MNIHVCLFLTLPTLLLSHAVPAEAGTSHSERDSGKVCGADCLSSTEFLPNEAGHDEGLFLVQNSATFRKRAALPNSGSVRNDQVSIAIGADAEAENMKAPISLGGDEPPASPGSSSSFGRVVQLLQGRAQLNTSTNGSWSSIGHVVQLLQGGAQLNASANVSWSSTGHDMQLLQGHAQLNASTNASWSSQVPLSCTPAPPKLVAGRPRIFVVVPGFGDAQHQETVKGNVRWLRQQDADVTCRIFVYKSAAELPLNAEDFAPCEISRRTGYWTHFVHAVSAADLANRDYVLVWFDDVALQPGTSLRRMVDVMSCNGISLLSPTYTEEQIHREEDTGNVVRRWDVMYKSQKPVGRRVSFLEYQFTLMTPASFHCLLGVVEPEVAPRGWGVDVMFPYACPGHCMALLDETWMHDTGAGSYSNLLARDEQNAYFARHSRPPDLKTSLGDLAEPRTQCGSSI